MRTQSLLVALALTTLLVGCGSSDDEASADPKGSPPRVFDYPNDDTLRLNHLQMKGTHNSYHVEKEGNGVPEWRYTHPPLDVQLATQGVRAVELDTQYSSENDAFLVFHVGFLDEISNCPTLTECIRAMASWSAKNPAHHPIFVQIEPKDKPTPSDPEGYFEKLEATILGELPRERIVTPDDVRGEAPTLREAIVERGWPTLGEARGKFLFFVDKTEVWRDLYTRGGEGLDGRLMFIDSGPDDSFGAVRVLNDPFALAEEIEASVRDGFIVRTRADGDGQRGEGQIEAALASGAHIVSTDFPVHVSGGLDPVTIPGGTPSRCNPISAPEACTSKSLEDPAFMSE